MHISKNLIGFLACSLGAAIFELLMLRDDVADEIEERFEEITDTE